ncbi:transporter substrate-binding domain-containing protein [Dasania sp. GY-MA-18]|uniref:transporter substrate-binding domain-containing protein n=1 Tax=Dasania sp. GY-MA-18 TaxID=2966584 RepID=UPI0021ABD941|nr:transporter substrate-binding domain-containing protein [Dasania sp. GY-MA-18]MCR8924353.1 transporter substrate-binding domain-containing protein [Dasania sp. GY-MA-18]
MPKIQFMPLKRAFSKVASGDVEMAFGALRNDMPLRYYPDCPVHFSSPDIAVSADLDKNWKGLISLSNKTVAARIGDNYAAYLPANVNYKEYSSLKAMMKMLAAGRVDAVLDLGA